MLGDEKMIGAVVFVISFVLFTLISLPVKVLPPGVWVYDWIPEIKQIKYASLVNGVINGVVYGVVIWLVFSIAKMAWERRKKQKAKAD